jgi:hypothetical protein
MIRQIKKKRYSKLFDRFEKEGLEYKKEYFIPNLDWLAEMPKIKFTDAEFSIGPRGFYVDKQQFGRSIGFKIKFNNNSKYEDSLNISYRELEFDFGKKVLFYGINIFKASETEKVHELNKIFNN